MTRLREDIQALRGFAVVLVLLYHAKIGPVTAGWLGVDIFFVISGFLITSMVTSGINRGDFRLADFYFRRAKRLLPAAYVTFLTTCLCAPWFLSQRELRDFAMQVVGAVTFTANFVLWRQTGYFEGAGDLKPFLHTWSLAIEEQFYFLLPVTLLSVRRTRWLALTVFSLAVSLGLGWVGAAVRPIPTFFLLPTRAWELLAGTLGAVWRFNNPTLGDRTVSIVVRLFFAPSLIALVLLPVIPTAAELSTLKAVLVCAATLIVILKNSDALNSSSYSRGLARIGDLSYSLYLVHWPVMAFINNAWTGAPELPLRLRLTALLLSFGTAFLLHRFVEDPARRSHVRSSRPLLAAALLSSLSLVSIVPLALLVLRGNIDFVEARRPNFGLNVACDYVTPFMPRTECQVGENPDVLVWGDSYAMHLVPGLVREWDGGGVIQATRSSCGPILGLAPHRIVDEPLAPAYSQTWAESCIGFSRSVVDFLQVTPSIQIVVLSSPFEQYFWTVGFEHVVQSGKTFAELPAKADSVLAGLRLTVDAIRALGKKAVIVAPPPSADFNIGLCLERMLSGRVALGAPKDCLINRAEYQAHWDKVFQFLAAISNEASVSVIRFDAELCGPRTCDTLRDGTMIYRDKGHLSYAGSVLLAKRVHLAQLVREQAK